MTNEEDKLEPNGAVAIVYRNVDGKNQYLLANQKSGNISLVGGGCEEIDQDLDDTLVREVYEEIGLNPDQYTIQETDLKYGATYHGGHRAGQSVVRQLYIVKIAPNLEISPNLEEIAGVFWASEDEAIEKVTIENLREVMLKAFEEINV